MFCTECGSKLEADAQHCTQCGAGVGRERGQHSDKTQQSDSSLPKGCAVLFLSIFTMPIKTGRVAAAELRKVGQAGALDTDNDFPHLSWFKAILPVIATAVSLLVIFYGFIKLFSGNEYESFSSHLATFLGSFVMAIVLDWSIMLLGEGLTISIAIAQYVSHRSKGSEK